MTKSTTASTSPNRITINLGELQKLIAKDAKTTGRSEQTVMREIIAMYYGVSCPDIRRGNPSGRKGY